METVVLLIILYVLLRPLYLAFLYARPPRIRVSFFTPTSLGVPYDDVTLTAPDGVELAGWYVHARNGAAVIMLHGHSGNRLGTLQPAEALIRAGYGVLLFDLRAHGSSGGRRFGRSQVLVDDVLTAVAYLSKRPDVNAAGIGVYGVSVGGLLALHAAAQTVTIRAVAADGASPGVMADLPAPRTVWQRLVTWPVQRFYMWAGQWLARMESLPPYAQALPRIAPRPLLLISTGRGLERTLGRHYLALARLPKLLWELPEAQHAAGWLARPDVYEQTLLRFFNRFLRLDMQSETSEVDLETAVLPRLKSPELEDATLSFATANVVALLTLPLAYLLFFWPYGQRWGSLALADGWLTSLGLAFAVSIVLHEALHAVGFMGVGKASRAEIKFGFSWRGLAPYAHCQKAMSATAYRWSVLLPGLLLGVVPGVLGVLLGSGWLVVYGSLMLVAAGGDTAVLWAIRDLPGETLVLDHPEKVGCQIISSK